MKFRYEVAGFSGYTDNLDALRNRLIHLRDEFSLSGEMVRIYRNQCDIAGIFEHRGNVDKVITL